MDKTIISIIRGNLGDLAEKIRIKNFNPNNVDIEYYGKSNKISIKYYDNIRFYNFTEMDASEDFTSLSEKIFNDILSDFITVSMYVTNKRQKKIKASYVFNTVYKLSAALSDHMQEHIMKALFHGAKKIEVLNYSSKEVLISLDVKYPSLSSEDFDEDDDELKQSPLQ